MCGRFSLRLDPQEIRQELDEHNLVAHEWIDQDQFIPRYNIAPRSQAPVIRRSSPRNSAMSDKGSPERSTEGSGDQLTQTQMKWGLVPHWSKYEDKSLNTMNARSENLISGGGMWNSLRGRKRCVVICQGYYEWLSQGKKKSPHFIKATGGSLLLLAGLYDSVELQDRDNALWSFSIVTTAASDEFSWLHDRQPVILSTKEDLDRWLDTSSQRWSEDLAQIVSRPYLKDFLLECYQVPNEVGKIGSESSSFILPISVRKDGIEAMFSKQSQGESAKNASSLKRKRSHKPKVSHKSTRISAIDSSDDDVVILEHPPILAKKKKV
ncbi:hypothetical protein J3R30DRAFT_2397805 [Lentinula aciculospora]|uniref:DUF159-domain-containing protein n=1 Tax=Lentinula aciculospora TaxID=153920 RepID=A0A9W9DRC8_9AGAR|nr:hypothetical protein J3R30DRAFT_2397805 [Lentinula aciculospora]